MPALRLKGIQLCSFKFDVVLNVMYFFRALEELPLLHPSTMAEYLKRFDEIQKRLGKTLHNN